MSDKVLVISATDGRVGMAVPQFHFIREWNCRGAKIMIDKDILREAIYDPGINTLFTEGLLYIDDMEFKKEIGLEAYDATEDVQNVQLDLTMIERMLVRMPIFDFKTEFVKYSRAQQQDIIDYAVAKECITMDKAQFIKEKTGVDVIKVLTNKHANQEEPKNESDSLSKNL